MAADFERLLGILKRAFDTCSYDVRTQHYIRVGRVTFHFLDNGSLDKVTVSDDDEPAMIS